MYLLLYLLVAKFIDLVNMIGLAFLSCMYNVVYRLYTDILVDKHR